MSESKFYRSFKIYWCPIKLSPSFRVPVATTGQATMPATSAKPFFTASEYLRSVRQRAEESGHPVRVVSKSRGTGDLGSLLLLVDAKYGSKDILRQTHLAENLLDKPNDHLLTLRGFLIAMTFKET